MDKIQNDRAGRSDFAALLQGLAELHRVPEWLLAPLQPEKIRRALLDCVPEFATGGWSIRKVKAKRLVLMNTSGCWEGTYTLTCALPDGEAVEYALHGRVFAPGISAPDAAAETSQPLGSAGWSAWLPDLRLALTMEQPELELVALDLLTGQARASALLQDALRQSSILGNDTHLTVEDVQVLSYKPGSRCTILYRLAYQPELPSAPHTAIGKIYRKSSKAENAYNGMARLWDSPLASGAVVRIAQPLALRSDLKAMFQSAIGAEASLEDVLKDTLTSPTPEKLNHLRALMRKAAKGLAAFHQSNAFYGKTILLDERIVDIEDLLERLSVPFPDIQQRVRPLLEQLQSLAEAPPADPAVPTHGTFNPEQVLIEGDSIGFIDFDDYCTAEPALDVGLFLAAIKDTGMNALDEAQSHDPQARSDRLGLLDDIGSTFLEAYQACVPVTEKRVRLWEAFDYLRNSLHFWVKVKPSEPDHALITLEHLLARL